MSINPMQSAHDARCKAKSKRTGLPCRSPAVNGYRVCRIHGMPVSRSQRNSYFMKRLKIKAPSQKTNTSYGINLQILALAVCAGVPVSARNLPMKLGSSRSDAFCG
jgi:hypothetical protein